MWQETCKKPRWTKKLVFATLSFFSNSIDLSPPRQKKHKGALAYVISFHIFSIPKAIDETFESGKLCINCLGPRNIKKEPKCNKQHGPSLSPPPPHQKCWSHNFPTKDFAEKDSLQNWWSGKRCTTFYLSRAKIGPCATFKIANYLTGQDFACQCCKVTHLAFFICVLILLEIACKRVPVNSLIYLISYTCRGDRAREAEGPTVCRFLIRPCAFAKEAHRRIYYHGTEDLCHSWRDLEAAWVLRVDGSRYLLQSLDKSAFIDWMPRATHVPQYLPQHPQPTP